jgi:hypothetical protein
MPDPTPGEICYTTWFAAAGLRQIVAWSHLTPTGSVAWDAAAAAVLAMQDKEEDTPWKPSFLP